MTRYKRVFLVTNKHADTYGAIGVYRHWVTALGMLVLQIGSGAVAYFPDELTEIPV